MKFEVYSLQGLLVGIGIIMLIKFKIWRCWPNVNRYKFETNVSIALVVAYLALNLPNCLFEQLRGNSGKWISFAIVAFHLVFPHQAPEDFDVPAALIILVASSPTYLAVEFRQSKNALLTSLAIGAYIFYRHVKGGSFRKAFTERPCLPITFGILLMFAGPILEMHKRGRYY